MKISECNHHQNSTTVFYTGLAYVVTDFFGKTVQNVMSSYLLKLLTKIKSMNHPKVKKLSQINVFNITEISIPYERIESTY